jgi:steroid delta-isomerase-like uncharacterized protein
MSTVSSGYVSGLSLEQPRDRVGPMGGNDERQRDFVERVQGAGELQAVDEFIASDFRDHTPFPGLPGDREGARQVFAMIRSALPDHDAQVEHMIADGDLVATYKTFTGTHEGELLGVPPTGRRVTIRVMDFVRHRDGQIVEHWNIVDVAGLLAQMQP